MNKEVLAVVAGEEITQQDLEAYLQGVPREQQAYISNPQFREQCLDQLISIYLFAKKGEEDNLEELEEYKKIMASARRDVLAQLAMREVLKDVNVSEEEAKTFYEVNKEQFKKGETVSAKHILMDTEEKCNEVLETITKGEKTFEDAAKECSTCPSGQQGGDLGEFGRGQMVPEFEEAAFNAEIGQIVGPVKTQFGCHLIKVEAKKEAQVATYEEVEEIIKRNLLQQKQNQVYLEQTSLLKERYVEV